MVDIFSGTPYGQLGRIAKIKTEEKKGVRMPDVLMMGISTVLGTLVLGKGVAYLHGTQKYRRATTKLHEEIDVLRASHSHQIGVVKECLGGGFFTRCKRCHRHMRLCPDGTASGRMFDDEGECPKHPALTINQSRQQEEVFSC